MKQLKKYQFLLIPFLPILVIVFVVLFTHNNNYILFRPQGMIAQGESTIIKIFILFVLLCIALPVFLATFLIAWKYKEDNTKAAYKPDWVLRKKMQVFWWTIPTLLIVAMGILMWQKTHELDPSKTLVASQKPLTIQVVSLRWKWLFIYPQQNIATVNIVEFPQNTPITFELTADSPMNSFWIPNLSGQMYSMVGMVNKLHLIGNTIGEFPGSAAELNGQGFAGMRFPVRVVSQKDFDTWVQAVKKSPLQLVSKTYNKLAMPSENNPQTLYSFVEKGLYNTIIMKYMMPNQN